MARIAKKKAIRSFANQVRNGLVKKYGRNLSNAARELPFDRNKLARIESARLIPKADEYLFLCKKLGLNPMQALRI